MNEIYRPVVDALHKRSIRTYFQTPDQLVVSRQSGPAYPFAGNSFSSQNGQWYVSTWVPVCYRVPKFADVAPLCAEFVDVGECAQAEIPTELVKQFELLRLSDAEVAEIFGFSP
jgi:hypothetical protein